APPQSNRRTAVPAAQGDHQNADESQREADAYRGRRRNQQLKESAQRMQLSRKDLDKLRVQQQRPEDMGVLSDRVHTGHEPRRNELRGDRGQRSGDEATLTAQHENEAEHDTERRLVDETAEGEAGTKWPIPTHRREADRPEEQRDGAQLAIENHREEERRTR